MRADRTTKQQCRITQLRAEGFKVWETRTVKLNNRNFEVVFMVNEKCEVKPVNHNGGGGGCAVVMAISQGPVMTWIPDFN